MSTEADTDITSRHAGIEARLTATALLDAAFREQFDEFVPLMHGRWDEDAIIEAWNLMLCAFNHLARRDPDETQRLLKWLREREFQPH